MATTRDESLLVAPEAYVLSTLIDVWMKGKRRTNRLRAANDYHKYQNCGAKAARGLFGTGW